MIWRISRGFRLRGWTTNPPTSGSRWVAVRGRECWEQDLGDKRIGVAISDGLGYTAQRCFRCGGRGGRASLGKELEVDWAVNAGRHQESDGGRVVGESAVVVGGGGESAERGVCAGVCGGR